ncbi:hypothetical protein [Nonomuraea sp. NEAU-A123]|nr:hypothetical protein [Nonomuraea sp. NEAU-A123]MBT2233340.1 hypothetical protein [Nonomuraea sp. NEAU-A123]
MKTTYVERLDNSHRALTKHGHWTDAERIELRGRRGATTLGLRHPS